MQNWNVKQCSVLCLIKIFKITFVKNVILLKIKHLLKIKYLLILR
jgi:hypothetical protein